MCIIKNINVLGINVPRGLCAAHHENAAEWY